MYTRQSAAIRDAETPDDLSQAMANCNEPLSHRGPISLANSPFPNRGGVMRPLGNGGGVSGVSRAGPAGGPGQVLRGGVYVPDATQRVPPWGLGNGVGSGQTYPTSSFYGGNYYGADAYGEDYGPGSPTSSYLQYLDGGGNYYAGDTLYGSGDSIFNWNEINEGDIFLDVVHEGSTYSSDWYSTQNTIINNFPGPTNNNYSTYHYGGPTIYVEGDTIINNVVRGPGGGPSRPGRDGRDGRDGSPGDPGAAGSNGVSGRPGDPGKDGLILVVDGANAAVKDLRLANGLQLELNVVVKTVITEARFDPDTCEVKTKKEPVVCLASAQPNRQFRRATLLFGQPGERVLAPK